MADGRRLDEASIQALEEMTSWAGDWARWSRAVVGERPQVRVLLNTMYRNEAHLDIPLPPPRPDL